MIDPVHDDEDRFFFRSLQRGMTQAVSILGDIVKMLVKIKWRIGVNNVDPVKIRHAVRAQIPSFIIFDYRATAEGVEKLLFNSPMQPSVRIVASFRNVSFNSCSF